MPESITQLFSELQHEEVAIPSEISEKLDFLLKVLPRSNVFAILSMSTDDYYDHSHKVMFSNGRNGLVVISFFDIEEYVGIYPEDVEGYKLNKRNYSNLDAVSRSIVDCRKREE